MASIRSIVNQVQRRRLDLEEGFEQMVQFATFESIHMVRRRRNARITEERGAPTQPTPNEEWLMSEEYAMKKYADTKRYHPQSARDED
jgi:hypothetical protein